MKQMNQTFVDFSAPFQEVSPDLDGAPLDNMPIDGLPLDGNPADFLDGRPMGWDPLGGVSVDDIDGVPLGAAIDDIDGMPCEYSIRWEHIPPRHKSPATASPIITLIRHHGVCCWMDEHWSPWEQGT